MTSRADATAPDYSDLRALFINCTLKPSPELSHTQGLMDLAVAIMEAQGVATETIRAVDYDIPPGSVAEHDRARMGSGRLAGHLREGHGGRHPRARVGDLAG